MNKLSTLLVLFGLQLQVFGQTNPDSTLSTRSDSSQITSADSSAPAATLTKDKPPFKYSDEVYKLRPGSDIPIAAIGTGWSLYAFTQIYSKDKSSEESILALDKNNIPGFDRHGADVYHPKADELGDMLFYGSMPLPVILMLDKEIRKDGLKTAFLYLEAMSVTGLLYTSAVYFNDRHRPYTYNPKVPMDKRMRGGGKNSFFAGHVALVGTSTFFIAKMLNDYHPDSKVKWLPFTLAGIATGTTGLMRYRGGQHFLSDILIGMTVGTLSGILVPHVHKNKNIVDRRVVFTASYLFDTPQFGFTYKLSKK
ncbi:MAG: phosphatase PAP2 family protein [Chitinophagaceae bacterium]|nr:MAG: phosphatase PAP2 family protein [Chitinophagaceae bacterium]